MLTGKMTISEWTGIQLPICLIHTRLDDQSPLKSFEHCIVTIFPKSKYIHQQKTKLLNKLKIWRLLATAPSLSQNYCRSGTTDFDALANVTHHDSMTPSVKWRNKHWIRMRSGLIVKHVLTLNCWITSRMLSVPNQENQCPTDNNRTNNVLVKMY